MFGYKLPAKTEKHKKLHALIAQANHQHMSTRNSSQKVHKTFHSATPCKKILLISESEPGSHFRRLRQLLPSLLLLVVKSLLLIIGTAIQEKHKLTHVGMKLTMLFILEEDELALCFLRLFSSSAFPSFGFMISRLPPAVPSEEDLRRFSTNLPSRYGLRLLARSTAKRETTSNCYREFLSTNIFLIRTLLFFQLHWKEIPWAMFCGKQTMLA